MYLIVGMNYTDDGLSRVIANMGMLNTDEVPKEILDAYLERYDEVYIVPFNQNDTDFINAIVKEGCRLYKE